MSGEAPAGGDGTECRLHASAVLFENQGVVIRGPSGSGKSSLALSLLRRGERRDRPSALVADDQVIVRRSGAGLRLHTPEATAGLLEMRGVGLVRLAHRSDCALDLVVDLVERAALERLPEPAQGRIRLLGVEVRRVTLAARDPAFGADILETLLGCERWPVVPV